MPLIWSRDVSYLDRPKRLIYLFSWVLLRTISSSVHRSPNFKTRSANKSLISCVTKETVNRPVSSKKLSKCIYFLNLFFKIFFLDFFFLLEKLTRNIYYVTLWQNLHFLLIYVRSISAWFYISMFVVSHQIWQQGKHTGEGIKQLLSVVFQFFSSEYTYIFSRPQRTYESKRKCEKITFRVLSLQLTNMSKKNKVPECTMH